MSTKKRGLGRGLDALLGDVALAEAPSRDAPNALPIEQLQPGKYQPRTGMDADKLAELAESIRRHGVVQPVVVRRIGPSRYEIVAGERRWRAAQQAGLHEIPVVLRDVPDQSAIAIALIENIQRENLNPLEEAQALKRLIDEFDATHQEAADAVGRSRAAVSNLLRLLELAPEVRKLLESHRIDMGHARALLTLPTALQLRLAALAAEKGWSVRELEAEARKAQAQPRTKAAPKRDANVQTLENELSQRLSARVAIQQGRKGGGKLIIAWHSLDELDGILARIR
ncbi:MAG: ParB/RepB/Spo0J family partition protein [Xanthomonadales bacterium]|nr:putative chromosome-partitioning protein ParB [Xanthomonadales bacterium]MCC6594166.1 ParB/RepB/Spo0J family partition protein [Xanthomonadales bacterium]MCE7931865.1 ParB/RepB/Spo0J family partition protein [Xanthomonadales bacterium PRO6]